VWASAKDLGGLLRAVIPRRACWQARTCSLGFEVAALGGQQSEATPHSKPVAIHRCRKVARPGGFSTGCSASDPAASLRALKEGKLQDTRNRNWMGPIWSREKLPAEYRVLFYQTRFTEQPNDNPGAIFFWRSLRLFLFCLNAGDAGHGQATKYDSTKSTRCRPLCRLHRTKLPWSLFWWVRKKKGACLVGLEVVQRVKATPMLAEGPVKVGGSRPCLARSSVFDASRWRMVTRFRVSSTYIV